MEIKRSPVPQEESEPWKLSAQAETLYPENIYELSELSGKKAVVQLKCKWGPASQQSQHLNINLEGERSREQERVERQRRYRQMYNDQSVRSAHPEEFSPVAQYSEIVRNSRLTQYKILVDYKIDNQMTKNLTNKVYRYLKNKVYANSEVDQVRSGRGQENQIKIKITLDPISFKTVNVTAQTPNERLRVQDLPLPVAVVPMNMRKQQSFLSQILPRNSRIENTFGDMQQCKVQSRRIQTFDQVVYRVPITTCYSVIAKDCSEGQPKFAVLLKKITKQSEQKKIKILIKESEITCEPRQSNPSEPKCKVNGEEVELTSQPRQISSHNHVILREGPYVKIVLPEVGVKVYFDGYTTNVKVSREMERVQCGLCGDYNDEDNQEFRKADNEITDDLEQFHRSYLHQDSECEMDEQQLTDKNQYKYRQMQWEREEQQLSYRQQDREEYNDYEDEERQQYEQDSKKLVRSRREQEPVEKTKVLENGHELCFSKRPVKTCPPHTYATKFTKQAKVVYSCISRNSPDAEQMHHRAQRLQVLTVEVKDLPASFTETEVVPEMCRQF
jgi:hypothetical protein